MFYDAVHNRRSLKHYVTFDARFACSISYLEHYTHARDTDQMSIVSFFHNRIALINKRGNYCRLDRIEFERMKTATFAMMTTLRHVLQVYKQ